ncbi:MAG: hypothetical protein P1V97_29805 [Planctomycetota bacterium]|nr:hypothetical protein [Planctomycetota bacterium]
MPPRPITFRSNLNAGALALLTIGAVLFGLSLQIHSLEKAVFPALIAGFIVYQVSIQTARNYRAGFRSRNGRELFKADYLRLMNEFRGKLVGIDLPDMDSLFQLDFGKLSLEEQLDLIREFCLAMDRLEESENPLKS